MAKPTLSKTTKVHTLFTIKTPPDLYAAFFAAVEREAEMLNLERLGASVKARELMREYVNRIESISNSVEAKHAAKVLARGKRS